MTKNTEKETKDRLSRLESVIGPFKTKKTIKEESTKIKKGKFKTNEVVILLIISVIVSLMMGSIVTYKLSKPTGKRVDSELQEFINNYEYITDNYNGNINKKDLLDAALEAILQKLDKNSTYLESDTSSNFNTLLEGSYSGLGVQVYDEDKNIVIYSVFKNSPAEKAGLKAGDIIVELDGETVKGLSSSEIAKKIKNLNKKKVSITYIRDDKRKTVDVEIGNVSIQSVSSTTFTKNDKKVGYIGVEIFASNTDQQFKKALKKLEKEEIDGLIIDLRSNSGGYLSVAENIISHFLDSSHVIYEIEKDNNKVKHYSKGSVTKKYKIVVLVNEQSASASEIVASALHDQYGATLVGNKTFGKGTVQEMQDLSSGDKYKLTTKNWLTSKGEWINEKGINPDVEVSLDKKYAEDPSDENDNQLQTALNTIVDNTK